MKIPLALLLAVSFLAVPARAEEGLGEFKVELPETAKLKAPPPVQTPAPDPLYLEAKAAPAVSGGADPALFFKRLEDLGFDTQELRALSKRLSISFRAPGGDTYAEWGYIRKVLYIPFEFKEKDGDKIRYDLASHEIDTLIHEFTHAERSLTASETAARGTVAREHYEAVKDIWSDLRSRGLFYRYAWMKADEVSGYFMGSAVSGVIEAVSDIVVYNTLLEGSKAASSEGGRLLLPAPETAKDPWSKGFLQRHAKPFGRDSVYDSAVFKENALFSPELIHWNESQAVKDEMFKNILGLKPPKDLKELFDRLEKADNAWIKGVREKTAAARKKNALPKR